MSYLCETPTFCENANTVSLYVPAILMGTKNLFPTVDCI